MHVCAITCTADYIYLASDSEDGGGLFRVKCSEPERLDCVKKNLMSETVRGVCAYENNLYYSDKKGYVVFHCVEEDSGEFSWDILTGYTENTIHDGKLLSKDRFSCNATHAQCGPITTTGNSIMICDIASKSVRPVTDVRSLLQYHSTISNLFESFAIHSGKLGYRDTSASVIPNLVSVCETFNADVRKRFCSDELKPNGPHGCLPYVTISMFNDLKQEVINLFQLTTSLNSDYSINPNALLSVACEHHFATMRSRYPMPTLLQYCDLLNTVISESLKRLTVSDYNYFTHKDSYYPRPDLQAISVFRLQRPNYPGRKNPLTDEEHKLMPNLRRDFCAGKEGQIISLTMQCKASVHL